MQNNNELINKIPIVMVKNEKGPSYCPLNISTKVIDKTFPLSIELDCLHCIYCKGIKDNFVYCSKEDKKK